MYIIEQIKPDNPEKFREIYEDFRDKALKDYKYGFQPVEFEQFISNIKNNSLKGLILSEKNEKMSSGELLLPQKKPEGILIYSFEKNKVAEINVIHLNNKKNENKKRFLLLEELTKTLKKRNDREVISYPMLGKQETFVRDIALLNFKLIGQSIVKFDFQDPVLYRILRDFQDAELAEHKLSIWEDKYKEQVIELINLGFKNNKSANFDPRFLTNKGSENVLEMILTGQYGAFLPYQSRLLLKDGNVEGFCLAVMVSEDKINIPLITVKKHARNKGMGSLVLKSVLSGFIKLMGDKKFFFKELNATVDTDNYPAVRMYRNLGFREDYFYAHAYLKNY